MAPRKSATTASTPPSAAMPALTVPESAKSALDAKADLLTEGQTLAVAIRTQADYERAGVIIRDWIKPAYEEIDKAFDPNIANWRKGLESARADKARYRDPWAALESALKTGRDKWRREEELRKAAELEAQRRLIAADSERVLTEQAEALIAAGREDEAFEIVQSLADGKAAMIESSPLPAPLAKSMPRQEGITIAKLKRYRVVNESQIRREFMVPNDKAIQALITKLGKGAEAIVGGIEYYEVDSERY